MFRETASFSRRATFFQASLSLAAAFVFLLSVIPAQAGSHSAPVTRQDNVADILHDVEIVDPYRWLEDQESPETRAWIETQNAYTQSFMENIPVREELRERYTELLRTERIGMPIERNGRYFFAKRAADQDLYLIYLREGLDGEDQVLVDPHPMSDDGTTSVGLLDVSQDGKLMLYQVREGGEDEVVVKMYDVDGRTHLKDEMPKALYFGLSLLPDKSGFYYSRHDTSGSRVYFHTIGTAISEDGYVFGEGYGPEMGIGSDVSEDGKHLVITVFHGSAALKTEVYYKNLAEGGPVTTIVNDVDARFIPQVGGDCIFVQTYWNAPNGRILAIDLNNPSRENWRELIPETKAVMEEFTLAGGKIFVNYLENVASKVKVFESDGKYVRDIAFPTIGSVGSVKGRWGHDETFFMFSSFHVPTTIFRYATSTGTQEVWARLDVRVDTERVRVEQVWYESNDGTKVPMFIVHRDDLKLDGDNPTVLVGYGGFNVSFTPFFSATAVNWVEHGGIFALANLRGGGEFGEEWHRAGMLEKKQNVFDDFIAAAEWLIESKYTNPSRLAILGGSNGGLLVGAALVQRPELFKAVVCTYPLLDMLRFQRFLLAKLWVSEYGSPEDPEHFKFIRAYSPYHNVKKGTKYPATLFVTGDSDTRVAPLHARKMTALLQASTGSDAPVLLRYESTAGHSGGGSVTRDIEEATDETTFLCWQLGVQEIGED
ncbi:MAG: S9 family peptidase [Candidatus Eiseniibacteriota bacterium]|nr:MAG: S9 family peptidase [Candidatus Eisenbacteria bacterium]